jgi:hypothetical protein
LDDGEAEAGAEPEILDSPTTFRGDERLAQWLTINGACQDEDRHHRWRAKVEGGRVRVKNLRHGAVAANHAEYRQLASGEVVAVAPYISRQALLLALVEWWQAADPATQDTMLATMEALQPRHIDLAPNRVFLDVAWAGDDREHEEPDLEVHDVPLLTVLLAVEQWEPDGTGDASLPLRYQIHAAQDCMARRGFTGCECAACPGPCRMKQRNTHLTRQDCPMMAALLLLAAMPHPWRHVTTRHGTYAVRLPVAYQQALAALRWTEEQLPGGLLFEMMEARAARLSERGRRAA